MTVLEHAYDDRRLDGIRRKRMFAFLMDVTAVTLLSFVAGIIVLFLGVVTLGLAWGLFGIIFPTVAVLYSGFSIGSNGATPGMRAMGIAFRMDNGEQPNFLQGAFHVIMFYVLGTFLTPLVLIVTFFNSRKRLFHDMLIGATVENV